MHLSMKDGLTVGGVENGERSPSICSTRQILENSSAIHNVILIIMSFLCSLPEALSVDVLSNWCNVRMLVNVDSAVCNYARRIVFLAVISSDGFVLKLFAPDVKYFETGFVFGWTIIRRIKPNDVVLIPGSKCLQILNCDEVLKSRTSTLIIISWKWKDHKFFDFMNSFAQLTSVTLVGIADLSDDSFSRISSNLVSWLKILTIEMPPLSLTGLFLASLARNTTHLCKLRVMFTCDPSLVSESQILAVTEVNPGLRTICLGNCGVLTDHFLDTLSTHCSHIEVFQLKGTDTSALTWPAIGAFISKFVGEHSLIKIEGLVEFSSSAEGRRYISVFTNSDVQSLFQKVTDCTAIMLFQDFGLSSETFQDIVKHSPRVADLKLMLNYYFGSVQDIHLVLLQCTHLTALSLYGFRDTTDAELLAMFSVPNKLTTLQILSHELTTHTAIKILKTCPDLINYWPCDGFQVNQEIMLKFVSDSGRNVNLKDLYLELAEQSEEEDGLSLGSEDLSEEEEEEEESGNSSDGDETVDDGEEEEEVFDSDGSEEE